MESQNNIIENTLRHGFINFQKWENPNLGNIISLLCKYSFVDKHIECKHLSELKLTDNRKQYVYTYDFSLLHTFINLETLTTYTTNCECGDNSCSKYVICKKAYNRNMNKLTANAVEAFYMFDLEQFPNLTDIEFFTCGEMTSSEIISELETKDHNIKNIKIINCGNIDMAELQTYCSFVNITITTK